MTISVGSLLVEAGLLGRVTRMWGDLEIAGTKKGSPFGNPFDLFGSACWARTSDMLINSQLLYQLS